MGQIKKKVKGPRAKHVPQRTCIACRRTDAKRGLMRLVRDAEGHVALDPTGKRAGRGAYICHDPACWEQALASKGLARSLRRKIDPAADIGLIKSAQSLHKTDDLAESR